MIGLPRPCLMLVTDRRRLAPEARTPAAELIALDAQLDEAIAAGVDIVQVRERDLDAGVLTAFVRRLVSRAGGTRVLVNDRADVALAGGANGVHLRSESPPASRVRTMDAGWIIGRSVHEGDEVMTRTESADYLLFGAVFPTASKAVPSAGVTALGAVARQSRVPVLAIGGITPEGALACAAAGATGVAAIGLFLPPGRTPEALGAGEAVRRLRAMLE